ncbi:MAG: hypothetical protein JSR83_22125 [Proteobacteria bacterium]|nr:hypothetical protein [Pseudomonadota bacterium]
MTDPQAPAAPPDEALLHAGLARRGLELAGIDAQRPDGSYDLQVTRLQALDDGHGHTLYAPVRFPCRVRLTAAGELDWLDGDAAADAARADAQAWLSMLIANRQLAPAGAPLPPGATHRIEPDAAGRPVVRRARFGLGFH